MKLLVFGKNGQVASELQRIAPDSHFLSRQEADFSDPKLCARIVADCKADAVINAAAYTAVDRAEEEEALATVINGESPTAIAEAAAQRKIPFLHVSTDYVFEGNGELPWKVSDKVAPQNAYGRSKLVGEQGVQNAGGQHAIMRTSWVVSAHGNNFVKTMLRLSETRESLNIVNDQIGGPTAAGDIADALLQMARKMVKTDVSGTYHFAGAPAVSWSDFATEIFLQAGRNVKVLGIPTSEYPTAATRPLNSRMDCSEITSDFGVSVPNWKSSLSKILAELIPAPRNL